MAGNPNNIPQQLTSFVGRAREIREVRDLLEKKPLVTLAGAGGLGKTRLAIEVANSIIDRFSGGVWFVDLSICSGGERAAQAAASALSLIADARDDPLTALTTFFCAKQALLILDNCEHLVDSCARLADDLLRVCTDLRVLATSRQALNIEGEAVYHLQPLSLPDADSACRPGILSRYEAVQLFLDRAKARRADFEMTARNSQAIAQLCLALDGMPLALELAAACLKVLSIEQIVERLDDRFKLLSWGSRTAPRRQQSLQFMMDWSYDTLSSTEQALLRSISVFVGGFSLEACEHIYPGVEEYELIALLGGLVDKSLVIPDEYEGAPRYKVLETIRQYAHEKLAASSEEEEVREHHLRYFLGLAERAGEGFAGPEQVAWTRRMRAEYDNIRAATTWAARDGASPKTTSAGLRIVWAFRWFWVMHGTLGDGREIACGLLNAPGVVTTTREYARAQGVVGLLAWYRGDDEEAARYFEQALLQARMQADAVGASFSLNGLGSLARRQGDYEAARRLCEEALQLAEQADGTSSIGLSLLCLGRIAAQRGKDKEASTLLQRSLDLYKAMGESFGVASVTYELAQLAAEQHAYEQATHLAVQSLSAFHDLGVKFRVAQCLRLLAELASLTGRPEQVAVLYGAADALFNAIGSSVSGAERTEHERRAALARTQINDADWDRAWNRGASMSLDDVLDYARETVRRLEDVTPEQAQPEPPPLHAQLSARELEVLKLTAAHMTGREVAGALSISPRTVEAHVRRIYRKLELTGRENLAQYARDNNLT